MGRALNIVENRKIRETIKYDENDLIEINITYPEIKNETKPIKKINRFYAGVAKEYYEYALKRLAPIAKRGLEKSKAKEKFGAVIKHCVTFHDEKHISVLLDISLYDGRYSHKTRRAQVWSLEDGSILRAGNFIKTNRKSKDMILKKICAVIEKAGTEGALYEYDPGCEKAACKRFDFNRFYLTENGYAFYYECGSLSGYHNSFPVFVLPYREMAGCEKNKKGCRKRELKRPKRPVTGQEPKQPGTIPSP